MSPSPGVALVEIDASTLVALPVLLPTVAATVYQPASLGATVLPTTVNASDGSISSAGSGMFDQPGPNVIVGPGPVDPAVAALIVPPGSPFAPVGPVGI